jgi:hypothetical protein
VKLQLENTSVCFGLLSGPVLSQFLEASQSLQLLERHHYSFEEAYCRALAALERTGLEVTFLKCTHEAQDAEEAFIEWVRHGQVVTGFVYCEMESRILSALSGNSCIEAFFY